MIVDSQPSIRMMINGRGIIKMVKSEEMMIRGIIRADDQITFLRLTTWTQLDSAWNQATVRNHLMIEHHQHTKTIVCFNFDTIVLILMNQER